VQVHESIGLTYAELLRTFLRQDPDVIVVGETRDAVAARMALEAALTGRLVLTTMHTGDSLNTVARMREMGLEPFLIASSVLAIVSQRLVRRLCPLCRRTGSYPRGVTDSLREAHVLVADETVELWEAVGCDACHGSGFVDRIGMFEFLFVDQTVRDAIAQDLPLPQLREALTGAGLVPLAAYGGQLLKEGLTVPGEVLRTVRLG
jgi:type II secretory ATPase GspE/PulE/Tfp pilus assembly ATPase PilB-like protein